MATFTYDTKSNTALTTNTRSNAGTFTNDSKDAGLSLGLWISSVFPWIQQFPWLVTIDGQILTKDIRN